MKRWKKILLGVSAVLILAILAVGIWQRNNLQAVYTFMTQDSQTIAESLERQRVEHQQAIQEQVPITVVPPSTQQSDAILSGQVTPEQVKEELGITARLDTAGNEQSAEELVDSCVAELYASKVDIMAELGALKNAAVAQWNGLSAEERTDAKMREIGMAGLEDCYDLEVVVDNQVQEILARYRTKLERIGADTGILDTLWKYYCDEKASEKAYYLDQYMR